MKEPCARCGTVDWRVRSTAHCSECCCTRCHNATIVNGVPTDRYRSGAPCPHTPFGAEFEAVREVMES